MWPDKQIGVHSINNFFGPQLAKIKNKKTTKKTAPRYIATLIHKKQAKKRKQTRATPKHNIKQLIIT